MLLVFMFCSREINIRNTDFAYFLDSPVHVERETLVHLDHKEPKLLIESARFFRCDGFRGGAVYSLSNDIHIANSQFEENSGYYGGASYLISVKQGVIKHTSFHRNAAVNLGGSVVLDFHPGNYKTVDFKTTNFTHCRAASAGAIDIWGGSHTIRECRFTGCNSTFAWAVLRLSSHNLSPIENCVFAENWCRQKGCAIALNGPKLSVKCNKCLFTGNSQHGGAGTTLYAENGRCTGEFIKCRIHGNRERQFGKGNWTKWITLTDTTFVYDPKSDWMFDTPAPTASPYCHECPLKV